MLSSLFHRANLCPDHIAFVDDDGEISRRDLALRAARVAQELHLTGPTVGIMAPNGIDWIVAYLGAMIAGKAIVPLPRFFSDSQLDHIVEDAGIDTVLGSASDLVSGIFEHLHILEISELRAGRLPTAREQDWRLIIYTSGTTGTPKGVRLGPAQVSASVNALAATISPHGDDRYLGILPFSLLLEQITGILLPIHAGVTSYIASRASTAALEGDILPFVNAVNEIRPSVTVLVPEMLEGWVSALNHLKAHAPDSLRFAAVGGAHAPRSLVQRARDIGVPAFEGYGLSECCSVVAVNTPTASRVGSVGRPLPGVSLSIEDGEIVVEGSNVMMGYLGGSDVNGRWHTGDMGFLDEDGFVHVQGRCDNVLITSPGRNISPEWIEGMMMSDGRIGRCIVFGQGQAFLGAIIVPSAAGEVWFDGAEPSDVSRLIEHLCQAAPNYARPRWFVLTNEASLREDGFISGSGKVLRCEINAQAERFIAA